MVSWHRNFNYIGTIKMARTGRLTAKLMFALGCLGLAASPAVAQTTTQSVMLKPRPFIVGGTTAKISDFPWQVALLYGQDPDPTRSQKCGGSIISSYWVLTAAHCVVDSQTGRTNTPGEIAIVVGTDRFATGGQRLSVDKIVVNPQYNRATIVNDIALVRTSSPMQGADIATIDLADGATSIGGNLTVSGWGDTSSGSGQGSATLLKVTVPYASNATCNQPGSYNGAVTAGMMCAGFPGGGKGTCQGDSGGPLVIYGNGPTRPNAAGLFAIQVGIVSWAIGCAAPNYYTVYTRVSEYRDWISNSMAEVVSLVRQDFSDCSNGNVNGGDPARVGGTVTVTRLANGKTRARISMSHGTPNTTYHFFLKCLYILGDLRTNGQGSGSGSFDFPSNAVGKQFAFDMYPEGAPSGNKYQSVRVILH
jgi:secreted trypsin-like serine protease